MFLKWFDTAEVDAFAASLASEFSQRIPKDNLQQVVRGAQARLRVATDELLNRVARFASGRRLNIYKRARLANSLKWTLHEAGYEKSMVDDLTLEVAKKVSTTKYVDQATGIGNKKMP